MLALCVFIITMGELCYQPAQITLTSNLSGSDNRGRYLGFSGLMNTLGFALGPLIGGFLLDYFHGSPGIVWVVVGFTGVLCAAGFFYLKNYRTQKKR
jgi:MFS family permease